MIVVRKLNKTFKNKERTLFRLKDISFSINKGEYVALIGPDGSGKSTIIKLLCGLIPFDSGEIYISNYKLPDNFDKAKYLIGYLSQNFTLYRTLTVYENINYFASLFDIKEKEERIDYLLNLVGLREYKDRLSKDLSGGMKQKLSIACALIRNPEILILDEPTTGVDPRSRREIFRIIEERLSYNLTVIFSTSYMDEAERADRIIMLNNGNILGDYKTEDILENRSFASISIEGNYSTMPEHIKQKLYGNTILVNDLDEFNKVINILKSQNIRYSIKVPSVELFYTMRIREDGNNKA